MPEQDAATTEPSLEEALSELDGIVRRLDQGQGSLDESLARFERGIQLLRTCRQKLDGAELRIRELVDIDEAGNARLKPFDHTASHQATGSAPPAEKAAQRESAGSRSPTRKPRSQKPKAAEPQPAEGDLDEESDADAFLF